MSPDDPRHGSYAGARKHHVDGEKPCARCASAAAYYQSRREVDAEQGNPRAVNSIRAERRIRALVAAGWSLSALGPHLGVSSAQVHKWARGLAYVRSSTLARIVNVYDRLETTEPPCSTRKERRAISYALTVAKRNDWQPPLAWCGANIDDPNEQPDPGYVERNNFSHAKRTDVDPVVVQRILGGDMTIVGATSKAEKIAVVAAWTRGHNELERLTGWKVSSYVRREAS